MTIETRQNAEDLVGEIIEDFENKDLTEDDIYTIVKELQNFLDTEFYEETRLGIRHID